MALRGSANNGVPANYRRHTRIVVDRISRHISQLGKEAKLSEVHRFRTNSRRVEALVNEFGPDSRNKQKLLKTLSKLRKKAGKLRDLDVQIQFLENLKIPDRQNHRAQLLDILNSARTRRSRKFPRNFDAETVSKLRKRLRRVTSEIQFDGVDPLSRASERLPKLEGRNANEKSLHAFRIAAKGARYIAEIADSPEANSFVAELKKAQDAIGEWHDVLKLKEQAENLFGRVHDSPLVAALNNIAHARFRRASNAALEAVAKISTPALAEPSKASLRKPPTPLKPQSSAAVA